MFITLSLCVFKFINQPRVNRQMGSKEFRRIHCLPQGEDNTDGAWAVARAGALVNIVLNFK